MTPSDLLFLVALIVGAIELIRSNGRSLPGWGVFLIGLGLLWGFLEGVLG